MKPACAVFLSVSQWDKVALHFLKAERTALYFKYAVAEVQTLNAYSLFYI